MVAPVVLVVGGVYLYPAITTLVFSIVRVDVATFSISGFVGLRHYMNALTNETFQAITFRTLYFGVVMVVATVTIAFLIAVLLNRQFKGRAILRVVVLLPWALPPVVAGVLWVQMFQFEFGFINGLIRTVGGEGNIIWLGNPVLALHAVLVAEVWRWIPFATLFLLAGLQTVPRAVREAAAIDGAGGWTSFRYVTLPLMWPVILPVTIFLFVAAMKVFDTIFVLTRGGPSQATTTLNYLVFVQGFEQFRFGPASANAYILMAITLAVIALLGYFQRRAVARYRGPG
jgi:multiple sugar transport system permease protein